MQITDVIASITRAGCLGLLVSGLTSCGGEDPQVLKQLEQQKAEIAQLRAEDDLLQHKIGAMPQGDAGDIATAEAELVRLAQEGKALQEELAALQDQKVRLEARDEQYRSKFSIH